MHIQTHILSGWCAGNRVSLTPRERLFCMLAASLQDLDGLGIVVSQELYWDFHHKLGHGIVAGAVLSGILTMLSAQRAKTLHLYLAIFHLHLVMDYFGSGPGWPIYYFWPFSMWEFENPQAWAFFSWQNLTAAGALLAWTVWIAHHRRRTPLEVLYPSLDRRLVAALPRPASRSD